MTTAEKLSILAFLALITSVYSLEMLLIAVYAFRKLRGKKKAARILYSRPAMFLHSVAAIGLICLLYGYFIEPYWIQVNTIQIPTEKLSNTTFRIVQISDTHCEKKLRNEKKIVGIINDLKPDVIVFTGDALNTSRALPERFRETFKKLKANLAKLAVRGNTDIWYSYGLDLYGNTGFQLLDRHTVTLQKDGEEIAVSGLSCEYPHRFRDLLQSVAEEHFSVFLYHYSDLVEDVDDLSVDLYLSGHTHGGQVALPFYGAVITLTKFGKKYESGMYNVEDTILYVNRGIGLEGGLAPRVRFLARPEITVFDIKPGNPQAD